ncbi:MAG: hypothetical protein AB1558_01500 [Thermodesulfobacteriota bacterium]
MGRSIVAGEVAMPAREWVCLYCGHRAAPEIRGAKDSMAPYGSFKQVGHNPYSGDLHYQCPACEIVLLVDPIAVLTEKAFGGLPGANHQYTAG